MSEKNATASAAVSAAASGDVDGTRSTIQTEDRKTNAEGRRKKKLILHAFVEMCTFPLNPFS